jgi:protein CpxP
MKNKLTKIMAVLTVAGLMLTGPLAYAEYEGDNPEGGKGYRHGEGKEFFKDLNLTSEQQARLKAQRDAKRENNKATREELQAKMQALHEVIAKPGTTRADVNSLVGEVNELKGKMFSQKIDGVFTMKEILTPEQFAKMQAQRTEWMQKKHEGWGKSNASPKNPESNPS